jgi:hypothetical protein
MVTWTISIQFLGFHAVRCFDLLLRFRMFPRFPLFIFQTSTNFPGKETLVFQSSFLAQFPGFALVASLEHRMTKGPQ